MTLQSTNLIQHYACVGDVQGLSQLLKSGGALWDQLHDALLETISEGHVECARLLAAHVDLTYDNCCYFRRAVTKRCIDCAQVVIPTIHPNLPRGYIYVEDIITRTVNNFTDEEKATLLRLCGEVFDFKDGNNRALRSAVFHNKQYAIDVLYTFSDVEAALKTYHGHYGRSAHEDTLDALRARFARDCLMEHIDIPTTPTSRKM
jgi:hypothetical protein